MPRPIWSGAINFGLVNIPVKAFGAVEEHKVSLRLLCPKCKTPLRYKRVCPSCKKEVPWNSILRGYEVEKDKFAALTQKDLDKVAIESAKTIEILRFTEIDKLDPIYFDKPYYLVPDEGSAKSYYLLREALESSGKVAVGRFVMHEREHLVALRPYENAVILETMHFADEIRDPKEFPELRKPIPVEKEELELAEQLIRIMKKPFNPREYKDRYHEALMKLIEAKLEGKEELIEAKVPDIKPTKDLMEALKASIKVKTRE